MFSDFLPLTNVRKGFVDLQAIKEEMRTMCGTHSKTILGLIVIFILSAGAIFAQTTSFTYQGRLADAGSAPGGNYDLQFALFDSPSGPVQIGQTQTVPNVAVSAGVFTVTLDFGASAFPGASRWLEISARPVGAASFVVLTPRQQITSTPYAVKSLSAATAENAEQLGGVAAASFVKTDDSRLSDARDPKSGSQNYIQNSINQQAATNFNISGNGTAGGTISGNTVNAATQYNLGGQKILSTSSDNVLKLGNNTHVGVGPTLASAYQLEVEAPDKYGLRLGTFTPGGVALSMGGYGSIEIDAAGIEGGRMLIQENGNVGIGTTGPASKLSVGGTVESIVGGFKFPDGSVQTSAFNSLLGKVYTTGPIVGELEIARSGSVTDVATLTLPPGVYQITAMVYFENRANDLFQDNSRVVRCYFKDEFLGANHFGAPGNPMDWQTTSVNTVFTQSVNGAVSLRCGNLESHGQVFARNRRLTAVRVADNPQ